LNFPLPLRAFALGAAQPGVELVELAGNAFQRGFGLFAPGGLP
jgi:hypothetical protein